MPDSVQAEQFISWMHGPAAALGHQISVWFFPGKDVMFCKSSDDAARAAVARTIDKENAYVCMGQFSKPPLSGRGKAANVTAIGGLWADVDFGPPGEFHSKGNLPPTEDAARDLLTHVGAMPSVITHSGHGLQAFWLFNQPLVFEDAAGRADAAKLSKRWVDTIRAIAGRFGWDVDSVQDLARVMRIPGTTNWKGEPVEASILWPKKTDGVHGSPRRWTVDELSALAVPEELGPSATAMKHAKAAITQVDPVTPSEDGSTPAAVAALVQNDPTFKRTWERKRTDHPEWTGHEYDLSIASMLVQAGCKDQVIADAILARRELHGENPEKARRRDYLMRTISRARTNQESDGALNVVASMTDAPQPNSPEETSDERARALDKLSKALRVNLVKVIKHGRESSIYSLELSDGGAVKDVHLGGISSILDQMKFKAALADATGVVISRIKSDRWDKVSELMLRVAILVENEDSGRWSTIVSWLRAYVVEGHSALFKDSDWNRALVNSDPFVRDGKLGVHVTSFRRFLRYTEPERVDRPMVFHLLRIAGFEPVKITARVDERRLCRNYWCGPASVLGSADGAENHNVLGSAAAAAQDSDEEAPGASETV